MDTERKPMTAAERQQAFRNRRAEKEKQKALERGAYWCIRDELSEAGLIPDEPNTVEVIGCIRKLVAWYEQNPDARYVTADGREVSAEEYELYERGAAASES